MSQALMFTFLPDNLGSSNVIKLAMTQFLYSVCCAPWKNRPPPHTHTKLRCFDRQHELQRFYAFEQCYKAGHVLHPVSVFIAFEAHGRICALHGSGKQLNLVLKTFKCEFPV
jgi:hypothetical protein